MPARTKTASVEAAPALPGEGATRRSHRTKNFELCVIPTKSVSTLYDVVQYAARLSPDRDALGYRRVVNTVEEEKEVSKMVDGKKVTEKKTWTYFQMSPYSYYTYSDVQKVTREIGCGLKKLGVPENGKVVLFAPTSADWMLLAHGAFTQSLTIVTAYDTLGPDGLQHSILETGAQALFTTAELLPTVSKVVANCPELRFVVHTGDAKGVHLDQLAEMNKHLSEIVSVDRLRELGRQYPVDVVPPKPEDMCCIMYTSGSTGNPKGVILTHANLVAAIAGVHRLLGHIIVPGDSIMAYLPLAHVLEFLVENLCIFWGVTLGYGSVRTLTDASVRNCKGDIKEFRPTLMTGVPAVWESIRKGILAKINAAPPATQAVFHRAYKAKAWCMERGMSTQFFDKLVFNKIKEQTGGRLRFALSGGAPISTETQRFLTVCLVPILQGYGMTESCGMCTILHPDFFRVNSVGGPVPCCEIKLVDHKDAGYLSTNQPKPQGEIWIRGGSVTAGYWKRDDVTKESITPDGWLQTGDIGEWNPDGSLSIIDRKKNLVKLSNGEYIALEKLESVYKSCLYVSNICVYGDPLKPRPVAIVVPLEARLREIAYTVPEINHLAELGDLKDFCNHTEIKNTVLTELLAEGKRGGLKGTEMLSDIYICPEEWTTEGGLMTAAQKLKRNDIYKTFKPQLDAIKFARLMLDRQPSLLPLTTLNESIEDLQAKRNQAGGAALGSDTSVSGLAGSSDRLEADIRVPVGPTAQPEPNLEHNVNPQELGHSKLSEAVKTVPCPLQAAQLARSLSDSTRERSIEEEAKLIRSVNELNVRDTNGQKLPSSSSGKSPLRSHRLARSGSGVELAHLASLASAYSDSSVQAKPEPVPSASTPIRRTTSLARSASNTLSSKRTFSPYIKVNTNVSAPRPSGLVTHKGDGSLKERKDRTTLQPSSALARQTYFSQNLDSARDVSTQAQIQLKDNNSTYSTSSLQNPLTGSRVRSTTMSGYPQHTLHSHNMSGQSPGYYTQQHLHQGYQQGGQNAYMVQPNSASLTFNNYAMNNGAMEPQSEQVYGLNEMQYAAQNPMTNQAANGSFVQLGSNMMPQEAVDPMTGYTSFGSSVNAYGAQQAVIPLQAQMVSQVPYIQQATYPSLADYAQYYAQHHPQSPGGPHYLPPMMVPPPSPNTLSYYFTQNQGWIAGESYVGSGRKRRAPSAQVEREFHEDVQNNQSAQPLQNNGVLANQTENSLLLGDSFNPAVGALDGLEGFHAANLEQLHGKTWRYPSGQQPMPSVNGFGNQQPYTRIDGGLSLNMSNQSLNHGNSALSPMNSEQLSGSGLSVLPGYNAQHPPLAVGQRNQTYNGLLSGGGHLPRAGSSIAIPHHNLDSLQHHPHGLSQQYLQGQMHSLQAQQQQIQNIAQPSILTNLNSNLIGDVRSEEWRDHLLSYAHNLYSTNAFTPTLLPLLHQIHAAHPTHLPTLLLLACVYYTHHNHPLSLHYNQIILSLDPTYVEAMSNIGTTLRSMGRSTEAEGWWYKAVRLRPGYWDAVENLVGVLCSSGESKDEETASHKATQKTPRYREALEVCEFVEKHVMGRSSIQGDNKSSDKSKAKVPKTLPVHQIPRLQNLFYAKGNLKYALGDVFGARGEYEKGLELVFGEYDFMEVVAAVARISSASGTKDTTFGSLSKAGDNQIPMVLLQPEHAVRMMEIVFRDTSGVLPGLKSLSQTATDSSGPVQNVLTQSNQTTSTILLTLAKLFQDILGNTAEYTPDKHQRPYPTLSMLLPLYYLSLALHPSPSTCNNLGILLSTIPPSVAASAAYIPDIAKQQMPITGSSFALQYYTYGLQLDPRHPHLYTNLGSLLKDMGHLQEAIKMYEKAVECNPRFDVALANLGNAIKDMGRVQDSVQWYMRAVEVNPDFREAICGLVNAMGGVCDWRGRGGVGGREAVVDSFGRLTVAKAGDRSGWMGKVVDVVDKQLDEGAAWGVGLLKTASLVDNLVQSMAPIGDEQLEQMIRHAIQDVIEYTSKTSQKDHNEGGWIIRCIELILRRLQHKLYVDTFGKKCYWDAANTPPPAITADIAKRYQRPMIPSSLPSSSLPTVLPFHTFTYPLTARQIRLISHRNALRISHITLSQTWVPPHVYPPPPPPCPRIKLGYVSSDFNNHPLAHLMQSVFGFHDRDKFEVFCYATTPSDGSPYRAKIEREAEHFFDVNTFSTQAIVEKVVADGCHILVNLNGYTKGARNEVFAARPCPVQCSFMGFAGTLGGGWCDWIIADPTVCPPETVASEKWRERRGKPIEWEGVHAEQRLVSHVTEDNDTLAIQPGELPGQVDPEELNEGWVYNEKFIYMPHSYFVNDHKQGFREDSEDDPATMEMHLDHASKMKLLSNPHFRWAREQDKRWKMRREVFPGLRDDVFIFANFNQLYKIDPGIFKVWLRILQRVPNSILWLLRFPAAGEAHLLRTATEWAGKDVASRVIFTDVAPKNIHIHRGRVADLFLDTPECNAHTTAADILWSGTPILTFPRHMHKMCSRVAASIAFATGYGEKMVVSTEQEYENLAIQYANVHYEYVMEEPDKEGAQQIVHRYGTGELMQLRKALFVSREDSPLFDTLRWTRNLERGYEEAWKRWVEGSEFEEKAASEWNKRSGCIWVRDVESKEER